jgi:hypothetical protein
MMRCRAATCTDGVANGTETDIDCGGGACPTCGPGQRCSMASDCSGGGCDGGLCGAVPLFGARAPRAVDAGTNPRDLAVADLDGDGKLDIAITNQDSWDISLNWGAGGGFFVVPGAVQVSGINGNPGGQAIAVGDFDGDGKLDLSVPRSHAIGCCGGGRYECVATLVRNAGSRNWFGAADFTSPPSGCSTRAWAGKINNDTKDDVFFGGDIGGYGGSVDGLAYVWYGATAALGPTVVLGQSVPNAGGLYVTGGDLNRDGNNDLVTRNATASNVQIWLNDGTGHFPDAGTSTFGVAAGGGDVIVALVNGDSNPDLIIGSDTANRVGVAMGVGDGTFLAPVSYVAPSAHGVAFGDVTGDGVPDIVAGGQGVIVLEGVGDGTFKPYQAYVTGYRLYKTILGDFDGDGKLDVVAITNTCGGCVTGQGATLFLNGP